MNLIVNDEYIRETGSFFEEQYKIYNECVEEYIKILGGITKDGIISGQTHDAWVEFQNQVSTKSEVKSSSAKELGKKYVTECDAFITDLDKADGDLY